MKRKGFIYEKIIELDNIELAICKASMGKTKRKNIRFSYLLCYAGSKNAKRKKLYS